MESLGFPIDDKLREGKDPIGVVLDLIVVVFKAFVHDIQHWHHFRDGQIYPSKLRGAHAFGLPQKGHHPEHADPELLVHVSFLRFVPVERLVVLSIDQLVVVFQKLPINRTCCCESHLFLSCRAQ